MDNREEPARGGRPRKFDERDALQKMQRQLWTKGLSGASLDGIARSAGLNRPSLAAAFGGKDSIYAKAAAQYAQDMNMRLSEALEERDLKTALLKAFEAWIESYTAAGADGCFILCTAPADALTNPLCRTILERAVEAIDAVFLERLEREQTRSRDLELLAAQLGATVHSLAIRARAGWSPERLRPLVVGTIAQVITTLGK